MLHNKKAIVGETVTWIIATIIIIVILVFSVFVVSLLTRGKSLGKYFDSQEGRDLINTKSISGYLLTENDLGEKVFEQISNEGDLNDFNGPLGKKIFENEDYEVFLELKHEPYSSKWPTNYPKLREDPYDFFKYNSISLGREKFWLGENKYIIFDFVKN